jgi:hypothetical protein
MILKCPKGEKMKNFRYLLIPICLLFLSSCLPYNDENSHAELSQFILGKWEGTKQATDSGGDHQIRYKIEFKDQSKLVFFRLTPEDDYKNEFTYHFVSDKVIQVQGKRDTTRYMWELIKTDENLNLCFSQDNCIVLTRKKSELWWIIMVWIVSFSPLLLVLDKRAIRRGYTKLI